MSYFTIYNTATGKILSLVQTASLDEASLLLTNGYAIYEGQTNDATQYISGGAPVSRPLITVTASWSSRIIDPDVGGTLTFGPLPNPTKVRVTVPVGAQQPDIELVNGGNFVFGSPVEGSYRAVFDLPFPYQTPYVETLRVSRLVGDATATATATGELSSAAVLAANAKDQAVASGNLDTAKPLQGNASDIATGAGNLTTPVDLKTNASDAATASGNLQTSIPMSGVAADTASVSANMTTSKPLSGTAADTATASADLKTEKPIIGAAKDQSTATGNLP